LYHQRNAIAAREGGEMHGLFYLVTIVVSALGTHALARRLRLTMPMRHAYPFVVLMVTLFLLVDMAGIAGGWFYTPRALSSAMFPGEGPYNTGLPLEEPLLLAFLAQFSLVLSAVVSKYVKSPSRRRVTGLNRRPLLFGLAAAAVIIAAPGAIPSYTRSMLALAAAASGLAFNYFRDRRSWVTLTVFLLFTLVFDNVLCSVGYFAYPESANLHLYVLNVPIEDLIYAYSFCTIALFALSAIATSKDQAWRLFLSSRPLAWANTLLPFLGAALATGSVEAIGPSIIPLALWWGVGYNFFLYGINDLYDTSTDALNPRKGGVEGARLMRSDARPMQWLLLGIGLAPALAAALVLPAAIGMFPLIAIGGAAIYSAPWMMRTRSIPIVDSLIQDISADRRSGIATTATWIGARAAGFASLALYGAAALALMMSGDLLVRIAAILPFVSALNVYPILVSRNPVRDARSAWHRFLVLNVPLGAGAAMLLIQSWQ
jgi:lycopene cyclase domain-containing protein